MGIAPAPALRSGWALKCSSSHRSGFFLHLPLIIWSCVWGGTPTAPGGEDTFLPTPAPLLPPAPAASTRQGAQARSPALRGVPPSPPTPRGGPVGGAGKYSTLIKMSSTKPPNENEAPKERKPGLRNVQTTMLFRAVNPELFIKPNKPVMAFGLVAITFCVAYLGYLHATVENKNDLYEAVDSEGSRYMTRKTSKWD
ncbi:small integral membrane protein 8 [Columba livia]|uniref:small integral membrane protein 8 n=1 Tax=Columba livia TaxID=8932 RepID=UPI0031BAA45F